MKGAIVDGMDLNLLNINSVWGNVPTTELGGITRYKDNILVLVSSSNIHEPIYVYINLKSRIL